MENSVEKARPDDWRTDEALTTWNNPATTYSNSDYGPGELLDYIFFRPANARVSVINYSMPFYKFTDVPATTNTTNSSSGRTYGFLKSLSDHEAVVATLRVDSGESSGERIISYFLGYSICQWPLMVYIEAWLTSFWY